MTSGDASSTARRSGDQRGSRGGAQESMEPIATVAGAGSNVGVPRHVFLSHTSELGPGVVCGGGGNERLAAEVCTAAGRVLQYTGHLVAAKPWYERALAIRERVLGPDHP